MDDEGTEHESGWLLVEGTDDRRGRRGVEPASEARIDLGAPSSLRASSTLTITSTRRSTRTRAQQAELFTWLRELYPVWSRIDAEAEYAAARTGLAELALSGCTTAFDHHYVFPRDAKG